MTFSAAQAFLNTASARRSVYTIKDTDSPLSPSEIESIVKQALEISPSPWNIGSTRCIILLGANHKKLWNDIVYPQVKGALPPEAFAKMAERIEGFGAGLGTVLFFEDQETLDNLVKSTPMVEPMLGGWSNVVNGMAQYAVWTTFSVAGMGCSLQHYDWHPGVVSSIRQDFGAPEPWLLKAQLVFGAKTAEPGEKPFKPAATIDERVKMIA